MAVGHIINTTKTLSNDGYFSGGSENLSASARAIAISPMVDDRYQESVTEDPVLLQDRLDTDQKLYEIFNNAPWKDNYIEADGLIKIPKEDISKVFGYTREKLSKIKKLTAYEMVIAINEFYDFNYEYVVKKVLSPKIVAEILDDYYKNMGLADRIDAVAEEPLF